MPDQKESLFSRPRGVQTPIILEDISRHLEEQERRYRAETGIRSKINTGVEGITGLISGYLGTNQVERGQPRNARNIGTAIGELLGFAPSPGDVVKAGLPFAAIMKGADVYHGTQRQLTKFNPRKNDRNDVLGWMHHFAEDPEYSSKDYAFGHSKGIKTLPYARNPIYPQPPLTDQDLTGFDYKTGKYAKITPTVFPVQLGAKNTLDLVDPNLDDIMEAVAALHPEDKERMINLFKQVRRDPEDYRMSLNSRHHPDLKDMPRSEILPKILAEEIRLDPDTFPKTSFDAIRYRDMGYKSWAVPEGTPIHSRFGAPMSDIWTPMQVNRLPYNLDTGSKLELQPGFFQERGTTKPKSSEIEYEYVEPDHINVIHPEAIAQAKKQGLPDEYWDDMKNLSDEEIKKKYQFKNFPGAIGPEFEELQDFSLLDMKKYPQGWINNLVLKSASPGHGQTTDDLFSKFAKGSSLPPVPGHGPSPQPGKFKPMTGTSKFSPASAPIKPMPSHKPGDK